MMRAYLLLLTAALLSMQFSGCTVIGLGIGLAVDHRNGREHRISWDDTRSIPRGREVEVTLTSEDTLRGEFTGLHSLPADSYRCAYDSARTLLGGDSGLPRLGETVFFVPLKGPRVRGTFCGFEAEALVIRGAEERYAEYLPSSGAAVIRNRDGQSFDLDDLRILVSSRALPSTREFMLQSGGRTRRIPLERIQEVHVPPQPSHYWALGGLIGLAIDIALVAAAAHGPSM